MKFIKYSLLILAVFLVSLILWGMFVAPYQVDYQEERVKIPNLPPAWQNRQVALIADFQVGMWLSNKDTVKDIAEHLAQKKPSAVLIAGDFIYHPIGDEPKEEIREEYEPEDVKEVLSELRHALSLLSPLAEADVPVYAVLGNHDYAMEEPDDVKLEWLAHQVQSTLEEVGINVLNNESLVMESPANGEGAPLYLVGVGSHYADNDDAQRALAQLPDNAARLVLMHNPDSFASFPAGTAPLAMAGHTHGGQIRLPWTSEWSWMALLAENDVHADGWVENYGNPGNRLYVNRGIGFSVIPVRLNADPEVTLFTLSR
ncbi:metallophosphoesterase [Halomonas sp. McH1-25]|uniref:metallophosphoesterase n=1 Tax=unclassified Halomonas TaxID=2609666 RepID=UPI001EF7119A|nr:MULTISPECIES: metallophosphoesterase [unclassified Halomonas]MCG7599314.1 metallophosphoesterase [Halomonas sp. McH1-25]MCP1341182.1 metallophosphoesterase [Halomonas sp. FL8]MCP1362088.1 metallophosphoesterase [Halomonas sp. BBD45]